MRNKKRLMLAEEFEEEEGVHLERKGEKRSRRRGNGHGDCSEHENNKCLRRWVFELIATIELNYTVVVTERNDDANLTVLEPKNANAGAIDPEQSSADTNLTRKKIESTKGQDDVVKENSENVSKRVGEILQQFEKEGLFDNIISEAGDSNTSLTAKKLTKEGLFDDKTSKAGDSNTILRAEKLSKEGLFDDKTSKAGDSNTSLRAEKLPKDVEGNTSKDGLPLDTTNVNLEQKINRNKRKNMYVEVSSMVTDIMTREDRMKKHDPMYTGGTDYSEKKKLKKQRANSTLIQEKKECKEEIIRQNRQEMNLCGNRLFKRRKGTRELN
ncbi:uncharacterized protein LOC113333624 [Papaver somniferum]|uniref:uncharacterized protein LOC113333624 n=1 Tax=Papaver somniferum TaxID=3469 RepID=UPI000E6FD2AF|nr:uncharacterized protein LOC113333624 [Papaver somniferum]